MVRRESAVEEERASDPRLAGWTLSAGFVGVHAGIFPLREGPRIDPRSGEERVVDRGVPRALEEVP